MKVREVTAHGSRREWSDLVNRRHEKAGSKGVEKWWRWFGGASRNGRWRVGLGWRGTRKSSTPMGVSFLWFMVLSLRTGIHPLAFLHTIPYITRSRPAVECD